MLAPAVSQTFEPRILHFLFLRPALVRTILVGFLTGSAVFELLICSALGSILIIIEMNRLHL